MPPSPVSSWTTAVTPATQTESATRATAFTATVAAALLGAAATGFATLAPVHLALPGLPTGLSASAPAASAPAHELTVVPLAAVLPTALPSVTVPAQVPAAAPPAVLPAAALAPVAAALAGPVGRSGAVLTAGALSAGQPARVTPALLSAFPPPVPVAPPPTAGSLALTAARTAMGTRYVWGGSSPRGFDCSGLMLWSFKKAGISLPRSSRAQSSVGQPVARGELQPGDLVFFYSPVSHVGIYVGDGNVLHAPQSGDVVKISPISRMPFHNARRV